MAEYIVKSIIKVFCGENSLENLEKINPKNFNIEVVAIILSKSYFFDGGMYTQELIQRIITSKPINISLFT